MNHTSLSNNAADLARQLRLPLRSRVWKGAAGEFKGAGTGSSLDFQDHRTYVPGDDPRHINWQAYARTGQYSMKLYREEVRPVIDLAIDVSDSMFFTPQKAERTAGLLYFLVHSALTSGASLRTTLVKADTIREIPAESVLAHHWEADAAALTPASPAGPPALEKIPFRPNAIRVLLSDLLFDGQPNPIIRSLTAKQGSGIIFAPYLQAEASPTWDGNYDFVDAERNSSHPHRIDSGALKKYIAAYSSHFSLWHAAAVRHQTVLTRTPCEPPLQEALVSTALKSGALEQSK